MGKDMDERLAVIAWTPTDVQVLRRDWTNAKCYEVLERIASQLEDRSIEVGWEILETLLDMEGK